LYRLYQLKQKWRWLIVGNFIFGWYGPNNRNSLAWAGPRPGSRLNESFFIQLVNGSKVSAVDVAIDKSSSVNVSLVSFRSWVEVVDEDDGTW